MNQPHWSKRDRMNALTSIINIITSIPKGLGTETSKEAYYPNNQEDAVYFIQFLMLGKRGDAGLRTQNTRIYLFRSEK